jgi:hypothetical protein
MTSSSETTPGSRRPPLASADALRRLVTIGAFLLVGWLCFPGSYEAPSTGLDPSWIVGLNLFAAPGLRFGRDLIFTYGPLGYLARPLDVGDHLVVANWVRAAVFAGTLGTAALLLRRPARRPSVWLFLALLPLGTAIGRELDYEMLGLILLLCSAAVAERWGWLFLPAAGLTAVVPWIKFGSGACAAMTLGVALAIWLRLHGRWRVVVLASGLGVFSFGVLSRGLVGSWKGLADFLHASWEIARGYNASMVTLGHDDVVVASILVLSLLGAAAAWVIRIRPREVASLAIGSVLVVYAWKHSMVRQDPSHSVIFFAVVFSCVLIWLLLTEDRRLRQVWVALLLVLLVCLGVTMTAPGFEQRSRDLVDILKGRRGSRNLLALLRPAEARRSLRQAEAANLAADVLPAEWLEILGQEAVLVVPWEISICLGNHLRCVPYPTLQMYSTYTPMLDRWTADRLREVAPRFVIASLDAIDDRNMLWDCPETWETLLRGWEVLRQDSERGYLLLTRRATRSPWEERQISQVQGRAEAWIPLPPRKGPLRARLVFRQRWWAGLERTLFRARPVTLSLMTESGQKQVFRLVLETAADGLLIDAAPETPAELAALFDCCAVRDRARQIRISGPGARALQAEFLVVWSEVTTPDGLTTLPPTPIADVPIVPGLPFLAIDELNDGPYDGTRQPIRVDLSSEDTVVLGGWAADREVRGPAGGVVLRVDGGRLEVPAVYGTGRDDVARALKEPRYRRVGYRAVVSLADLGRGRHTLQLRVISGDGRRSQLSSPIEIDVR